MIKKIIKYIKNLPNKLYNSLILKYYNVSYSKDLKINGRLFCVSNNKYGINRYTYRSINSCRSANPIGGDTKNSVICKRQC